MVEPSRLEKLNAGLLAQKFQGVALVCPHTPDLLSGPRRIDGADTYLRWIVDKLLPRVKAEGVMPGAIGIDGVSLGGRVALLGGLAHPETFTAVGTLQPAIQAQEAEAIAGRAAAYLKARPEGKIRLLTSDGDYFLGAVDALHRALAAAGVRHEHVEIVGPHDYSFNRGPGALEMLLWHDRVLRGLPGL
jgi:enterochelin esterase-like enzyme